MTPEQRVQAEAKLKEITKENEIDEQIKLTISNDEFM